MARGQLQEREWTKIKALLRSQRRAGRPPKDDRNFIEAVLWWRRTGVPWRDLPAEFGPWKTVFNRFDLWSKQGRWMGLLQALQVDRDDEWHSIDSTINRAHQHAAGGKGGQHLRTPLIFEPEPEPEPEPDSCATNPRFVPTGGHGRVRT